MFIILTYRFLIGYIDRIMCCFHVLEKKCP